MKKFFKEIKSLFKKDKEESHLLDSIEIEQTSFTNKENKTPIEKFQDFETTIFELRKKVDNIKDQNKALSNSFKELKISYNDLNLKNQCYDYLMRFVVLGIRHSDPNSLFMLDKKSMTWKIYHFADVSERMRILTFISRILDKPEKIISIHFSSDIFTAKENFDDFMECGINATASINVPSVQKIFIPNVQVIRNIDLRFLLLNGKLSGIHMHNLFKSALKSSNPKDVVGFDYDLSEEQKALFISSVNNLNDLSKFFFMKDRRKFKIFIMMLIVMNISELSTSKVKQVACIITDNEFKIKSSGYNGVPSGFPHLNSNEIDDPSIMELHAEVNALVDCPDSKEELYMFCSLSPCKHCAKAIIASRRRTNISTIYYLNEYESSKPELEGNSSDVKKFLSEAGIELIKFEN